MKKLLIANRGEIAVRIMRTAAELGVETVAVYSQDDDRSLHVRRADSAVALAASGPAAYLDGARLVGVATTAGCDALHPGYGFLSESAALATACEAAGLCFVGPAPVTLETLGDKVAARALARECGVPVLPGTPPIADVTAARAFLENLGGGAAAMIKAVAGGGGRGMRAVGSADALESALRRCRSEAEKAFGNGAVYLEKRLVRPRHIEVQIAGDGSRVVHLGERDCSIQRRHQKVLEIAPAPGLDDALRRRLCDAALRMAAELSYRGVGTFEFLVDTNSGEPYFIEANARLQVEHTVTEEATGIDLVAVQLRLAGGCTLVELGLGEPPVVRGYALQMRVNAESIAADGSVRPRSGRLEVFDIPSGHGVRTDTAGYVGYAPNPNFDSLLAKVIAHTDSPSFDTAARKALRALRELRVVGIETNQSFVERILRHPDFVAGRIHTDFVDDSLGELLGDGERCQALFFDTAPSAATVGARIDVGDPLAVLEHGKSGGGAMATATGGVAADAIVAPLQGTVVSVEVAAGANVAAGREILILEAMKMEHVVAAPRGGRIAALHVAPGDTVAEGAMLFALAPSGESGVATDGAAAVDLDTVRADLAEARQRHQVGLDAARPEAVARRRETGHRTARENIGDLCDADSFVEYGALVLAAQRRRRSTEELIDRTPADGLVAGIGRVNGDVFPDAAQCVVLSYDYTVLAGTQGLQNHRKKDRMFELAAERRLPVVLFAEGGGGRPGDTDGFGVTGLDCMAFRLFGELSGLVPLVGITAGRCFAGNAALLGCCDVVIATQGSNIGMGGPAMVEGGGLGVFRPEEIGPLDVQRRNGVVDVAVRDEAEAVAAARRYLSYFQGDLADWRCADQRLLRHVIPENRLRVYDVHAVIEALADTDSILEMRPQFGTGMVTALVRIEGRAIGVVANNPLHLAGAIDSDGADKASRFMQLCDAFDLPLLFLCDTPGIMVGPEIEKTALVRHAARMFVTGASLDVPFCTVVLRKGYGLGAQAMAGGSFKSPHFTVAWPTGEFGGMGLEGAVKLGFRRELAAIEDRAERQRTFEEMVERMYQVGKAVNIASHFEIDDVIDPAETRKWVLSALPASRPPRRTSKKRPLVDTW